MSQHFDNSNTEPHIQTGVGSDKAVGLKEKASELKDKVSDKASELKDAASDKVSELKDRASELKGQAGDKLSDLKDQAGEKFADLKGQAGEKLSELKDQAGDKVAELKDQASEKLSQISDKAHGLASDLHDRTDRGINRLGEKMTEVAGTVREKGMPGIADRLESGGQYLAENGVSDIGESLTQLIRKHPMESMVIGLGIGVLLGSVLSARRTQS